jgi:hypothetical protein
MKSNKTIKFLIALLIVTTAFGLEWQWLDYPAARRNGMMIVDSLNQRIIFFGGTSVNANGMWYNDVWELPLDTTVGYSWHRLSPSGSPPEERCWSAAVYDPEHQRMIIFGGLHSSTLLNDVWTLNLTLGNESWERQYPSGAAPSPRYATYYIYHPTRKSMIVFGGTGDYVHFDDAWELKLDLDSVLWQEIPITGTRPMSRGGGGGFFDAANNRMIIFGGTHESTFWDDLWALDLTLGSEQWLQLQPSGYVPELTSFSFGHDPNRNIFFIFSGWNPSTWYNDLRALSPSPLSWTQLYPSGQLPVERRNSFGIYDYFNNNFLVFGGDDGGSGYFNETFFIHIDTINVSISEWQSQPKLNSYPALFVNTIASGSVRIRYMLPKLCNISVKILDSNGRVVRNLFSGRINSQTDWLNWNLKNVNNQKVSSGIYYCLLETEDTNISKKFVVTK